MSDDLHPSPDAAFARGRLLQSQHRMQDAIACYKQALELDAHHTPSFIMLALCWMQDDDTAPKSTDAHVAPWPLNLKTPSPAAFSRLP